MNIFIILIFMTTCLVIHLVYKKQLNNRNKDMWWEKYDSLDLKNGYLIDISDDDEDMLEIHYQDGMMIDVGYIEVDRLYYITVVEDDSMESWTNPLLVKEVSKKYKLPSELQNVINVVRK